MTLFRIAVLVCCLSLESSFEFGVAMVWKKEGCNSFWVGGKTDTPVVPDFTS